MVDRAHPVNGDGRFIWQCRKFPGAALEAGGFSLRTRCAEAGFALEASVLLVPPLMNDFEALAQREFPPSAPTARQSWQRPERGASIIIRLIPWLSRSGSRCPSSASSSRCASRGSSARSTCSGSSPGGCSSLRRFASSDHHLLYQELCDGTSRSGAKVPMAARRSLLARSGIRSGVRYAVSARWPGWCRNRPERRRVP